MALTENCWLLLQDSKLPNPDEIVIYLIKSKLAVSILFGAVVVPDTRGLSHAESPASWIMSSDENADCLRVVPGHYY